MKQRASPLLPRHDALEIAGRRSRSPGYRVQKNGATFLRIFLGHGDLVREPRLQTSDRLGKLIGAMAFGLWRQSFAAALFAGVGLFFLARIYNNTERMLAELGRPGDRPHFGDVDARRPCRTTTDNSGALRWMRSFVAKMWQHTCPKIEVASSPVAKERDAKQKDP